MFLCEVTISSVHVVAETLCLIHLHDRKFLCGTWQAADSERARGHVTAVCRGSGSFRNISGRRVRFFIFGCRYVPLMQGCTLCTHKIQPYVTAVPFDRVS